MPERVPTRKPRRPSAAAEHDQVVQVTVHLLQSQVDWLRRRAGLALLRGERITQSEVLRGALARLIADDPEQPKSIS